MENCTPLTIVQRCADWFLLRTFNFTGTICSSLGKKEVNVNGENLCNLLGSVFHQLQR